MTKRSQIKQELDEVMAAHGERLNKADIVQFARENTDSVLHTQFEWDDSIAAEKHRLLQAGNIVRLHVTVLKQAPTKIRAFVSIAEDRVSGGGFRDIQSVLTTPELRAQLLMQAYADLASFRRKYAALEELSRVFAEIDAAAESTAAAG